jgi:hypothetical protein
MIFFGLHGENRTSTDIEWLDLKNLDAGFQKLEISFG